MSDFLTSVVSVVVVLGFMILIHEWGHYIAARAFKVRVDVFSIGFGPRLWGRKRGDTDFRISALPLGGYVKMAGDNPSEDRAGSPDEFLSKPRWQRAIIALAGPFMNIVMAVVLVAILHAVGMPQPAYLDGPPVIGGIMKNSAAEKAGLRIGDLVVEVEGNRIKTWQNLILEIQLAGHDGLLEAVIDRNGERIPIRINISDSRDEFALLGFPREDVIVGQVTAGKPAEQAGLQRDDRILSINGEEVLSRFHFSEKIQEAGGAPVVLDILRGGEPLQIKVRPIHGDPGDGVRRWQIGFSFGQINVLRSYPPHEAVVRAVAFNYRMTKEILNIIGQLLRGKVSLKQLEGPVGIARQSGQAAKLGLIPLTFLTAVISLNLGILNLLPIPILDGGLILLLAVEGLRRRDFSIRVKEWYVQVGMVLLLVIFTAVMYNDLKKLLPLP